LGQNNKIVNFNFACWIGSIGPKIKSSHATVPFKGDFQAQANRTIGSQILWSGDILKKL
jgi:hypothetical protein